MAILMCLKGQYTNIVYLNEAINFIVSIEMHELRNTIKEKWQKRYS